MDFSKIDSKAHTRLQNIRLLIRGSQPRYNVGYAELAQYAQNTALIHKAPSVQTFVGRKDATFAAPNGLLPDANDFADILIKLFVNQDSTAEDLAASSAHTQLPANASSTHHPPVNKAQDTTIGVWDVEINNNTLNNAAGSNALQNNFVLPIDKELNMHQVVRVEFVGKQKYRNEKCAKAYLRMSLKGAQKTVLDNVVDFSNMIPASRKSHLR